MTRLHRSRSPTTYRGHRRGSFVALDQAELIEVRARQRTYEGAYQRTALLLLGQGAVILKVFDARFFSIGILYAAVSILMLVICEIRRRNSTHSFADSKVPNRYDDETLLPRSPELQHGDGKPEKGAPEDEGGQRSGPSPASRSSSPSPSSTPLSNSPRKLTSSPTALASPLQLSPRPSSPAALPPLRDAPPTPPPAPRIFGAPFVTASGVVLLFSTIVGLMEVALLVLVLRF